MTGEEPELTILVEHNGTRIEFKGRYLEVWSSLNRYLSKIFPALPAAQKLSKTIDVAELSESIADRVQVAENEVLVLEKTDAKTKILLALAGLYVGKIMGKVPSDTATPQQIARSAGIAERVARARLSEMKRAGLVVRLSEGRYRFSPLGEGLVRKQRPPSKNHSGT